MSDRQYGLSRLFLHEAERWAETLAAIPRSTAAGLCAHIRELEAENARLRADAERWRWLRPNMGWTPSDRPPKLASVSKRIWYHATDDEESFTLDTLADTAIARGEGK